MRSGAAPVRGADIGTPAASGFRVHPTEYGAWFLVGVPWAAGMVAGRGPAGGWLLGGALACGVAAREPLLWALWRWRRRLPAVPTWRAGVVFAVGALVAGAAWARSGVDATGLFCLGAAGLLGLADVAARVLWSKPTPAGSLGGAVAGGLVCPALLSGSGPPAPEAWLLGAGMAYIFGVSLCAMHLFLARVPRHPCGVAGMMALLWGWTVGAGTLLLAAGLWVGADRSAAMALGIGVLRAQRARRQPRTTAFRRLGWREACWIATMAALILAPVALPAAGARAPLP